ncbi:MAG: NUDIX domain-containing protein [Baekduia sp.]
MRNVIVSSTRRVFDGFFKIDEARVAHQQFDGTMGPPRDLLVFERGDAAAILLHDVVADQLVMTEQFRYPTYDKGPGWLLEIAAGMIDGEDEPEDTARREAEEELGYRIEGEPISLGTFYLAPGGSSERIHIFYAEVSEENRVGEGGGLAAEGEDIRVARVDIGMGKVEKMLRGEVHDAKTVIALQWFQHHIL